MTDEGFDITVACALVSLALNPLIFKFLHNRNLSPKGLKLQQPRASPWVGLKQKMQPLQAAYFFSNLTTRAMPGLLQIKFQAIVS